MREPREGLRERDAALPELVQPALDPVRTVGQNGRTRLLVGGDQGEHERQGCSRLQLHPNTRHVHQAMRSKTISACAPRRFDDHQEARQNRRAVQ